MDIGSILLILALLVLAAAFIARPLFERSSTGVSQAEQELSHWLAERDRMLNALQELDFDNAMGKIPAEDYPAQRALLLQQGADILRQLDALQPAGPLTEKAEDRVEAIIAQRRAAMMGVTAGGGNGSGPVRTDDKLEALIAERRRARPEKAAGFCPKCGGPLQTSDRFCPKCGERI